MKVNRTYSIILSLVAFVFVVLLPVEVKANKTNVRDYIQAAEAGNVDAQYSLSVMYRHGSGVTKNLQTSRYWLGKAVEQGDSRAQYDLAMSYYKGEGTVQNILLAERLFERSASQGHIEAQRALIAIYEAGAGSIKKNVDQQFVWLIRASTQGELEDIYKMGMFYRDTNSKFKKPVVAVQYFEKAADRGHLKSIYALGRAYAEGQGVEKDLDKAEKLFLLGAEKEDPFARFSLGELYLSKDGFQGIGLAHIRAAAESGVLEAQFSLANIYIDGEVVPRDPAWADVWLFEVLKHPRTNCPRNKRGCWGGEKWRPLRHKILKYMTPEHQQRQLVFSRMHFRRGIKPILELR